MYVPYLILTVHLLIGVNQELSPIICILGVNKNKIKVVHILIAKLDIGWPDFVFIL